jgi:hypothetical protein
MMTYLVKNAVALWPKLNKTYRFDQAEKRSVACDPKEDGACYSIDFEMDRDTAMELHAYCQAEWDKFAAANPGTTYDNKPYKAADDPQFVVGKAKLKGAYNGEPTRPPLQFDAKNQSLPADFMLTTGSKVNVAVVAIPYATGMAQGVSLRLRAVQVVELRDDATAASPFGEVEGFSANSASPFKADIDGMASLAAKLGAPPKAAKTAPDDEIPF